jgi:hypothetical protein
MVDIVHNLLTEDELNYVYDLIKNESKWVPRTTYDQKYENGSGAYFDSIHVDDSKLEEYYKKITDNGEYKLIETAINIIKPDRQLDNSKHHDAGDLSFVTYLNDGFEGGKFFYYNYENIEFSVTPYMGLSLKINNKTEHRVEPVTNGVRFSLYTFLRKKQKINKTLL